MKIKKYFKSFAIMFSIFCMMFLSPVEAKSCTLIWCGTTYECEEDRCIFNVGDEYVIITCGEEISIHRCVPDN